MRELKKRHLGPIEKKILLLLMAGFSLSLTITPGQYFKILTSTAKEWRKFKNRSLKSSIQRLYQSNLLDYHEAHDGTISLLLNEKGRRTIVTRNLDTLTISKPDLWDGLWRIVMFDIPELHKKGRDALSVKLKELGFFPLQKSVFIFPYECRKEIEFVVEIFELKAFVRYLVVQEIDTSLDLEKQFRLRS